jgi:hypothetical protein
MLLWSVQMQHGITTLFCFRVFILVETLWSKPTRLSISTTDSQFAEFKSDIYVILGSMSKINIFKSVTILQLHYANISSQVHLAKLPKNLLAKTSLTKNTEHVRCPFCIDEKLYPCNVHINICILFYFRCYNNYLM